MFSVIELTLLTLRAIRLAFRFVDFLSIKPNANKVNGNDFTCTQLVLEMLTVDQLQSLLELRFVQ